MQFYYYAPTFIDESLTRPDRGGNQYPTGRLSGMVFGRKFFTTKTGKVRAERVMISFSWGEDTPEAKVTALAKAIEGMEELPELDKNPPLTWIPSFIKEKAHEVPETALR